MEIMRNFKTELLFHFLICHFIQVSDTLDYFSDANNSYCYDDPDPSFCFLCGCFKKSTTEHTLGCAENEVIRMELAGDPIKSRHFNHADQSTCVLTEEGLCKTGFDKNDLMTTYKDRVEVYKNCTLQNTCTITVKPVDRGNVLNRQAVKLVRYPYVCESSIGTLNISNSISQEITDPVLYFTGQTHVGKNINCECMITPSGQQPMELELFFIYGDNMCNHVTINSSKIFQCEDNAQLYTSNITVTDELKVEVRDITATGDEVLYFKVHGNNLNVDCTGCLLVTDSVSTSSSTTESTTPSSIPLSTRAGSTMSSGNTDQDSSTNDNSGNTAQSPSTSNQNINQAGFISQDEYEEKLNETYAMFGGIIAAVVIITVLGNGIYYYIRKRNKPVKSSDGSNQSPQNEYAHADFHLPDGSDIPQYQGLYT